MSITKPEIRWILDITIAYPDKKPLDLLTIITGSRPPCETVLFYRLYPTSVVRYHKIFHMNIHYVKFYLILKKKILIIF